MNAEFLSHLSTVIRDATHCPFMAIRTTPVGGGSINAAFRLDGKDGPHFFLKLNDARHHAMFVAEAAGLEAIAATATLRVPHPIAHGIRGNRSYLVLEYLQLSSLGDATLLGEQLAALHRCQR